MKTVYVPKLTESEKVSFGKVCLITTLTQEVTFLRDWISYVMSTYSPPKGDRVKQIVSILLKHCHDTLSLNDKVLHERIILKWIEKKAAIPVTISMALGGRIPNPLKMSQETQLPTFAWLHLIAFFTLINEKVKRVYHPGLRIVVFEEANLDYEQYGLDLEKIKESLRVIQSMIDLLQAPVEIIPLAIDLFEEGIRSVIQLDDRTIYSELCCLPEMVDPRIMASLYTSENTDFERVKQLAGPLWQKAAEIKSFLLEKLAQRKQPRWDDGMCLFEHLIQLKPQDPPILDASVTRKMGRFSFKPTSPAYYCHGMPVIRRGSFSGSDNYLKVEIHPQYRIVGIPPYKLLGMPEGYIFPSTYPEATPVLISPSDFGLEGEPYVFYYYLQ